MNSLVEIGRTLASQPPRVGVLLGQSDVGKGREGLYRDQLPELLAGLAAQTRVESIRASTAIEGYDVPAERAARLAATPPMRVRNRNEKEFAGYRDAIDGLIRADVQEPMSLPLILHLHRQLFAHSGGRGGHLKAEDNRIVRYGDDGRQELIFEPVPWQQAEFMLCELVDRYNAAREENAAHPLVLIAILGLDFLAIHPVLDGNGRLVRLLTTHELLRAGYGVARYVSIEQRIYETRNAYYAALRESQAGWHEARHDPWPWIEYFAGIMAGAYAAFEARVATARSTHGLSKQAIVRRQVEGMPAGTRFRMRDLRRALPGISDPTLRLALIALRDDGVAVSSGHGSGAFWTRLPRTEPT